MMTCVIAIVAFREHKTFNGFKHLVIPLFGLLANLGCMLFLPHRAFHRVWHELKEPYIALGVAALWGIYGGWYFKQSSKDQGRAVLVSKRVMEGLPAEANSGLGPTIRSSTAWTGRAPGGGGPGARVRSCRRLAVLPSHPVTVRGPCGDARPPKRKRGCGQVAVSRRRPPSLALRANVSVTRSPARPTIPGDAIALGRPGNGAMLSRA